MSPSECWPPPPRCFPIHSDDVSDHNASKNQVNLRQLEFMRLDEHRILVILVLDDREVQNRVIHVEEPFSDNELSQAAALINREFGGRPLMEVRHSVIGSMREDEQMDASMKEPWTWRRKLCPVATAMGRMSSAASAAAGFLRRYVGGEESVRGNIEKGLPLPCSISALKARRHTSARVRLSPAG